MRDILDKVRATVVAGDVRTVERVYAPAVFALGVIAGCVLALLSAVAAVLVVLVGGVAIGYAARSVVSYRRRERFRRTL